MGKEDNAQKAGRGQPETERKFSQQQYDMLKRCSEKKHILEWNEWRKKNPNEDILLEKADLYNCYLKGAFLNKAVVIDRHGRIYVFNKEIDQEDKDASSFREMYNNCGEVYLEKANLRRAHLEGALLYEAHLSGADINDAYLEHAEFWRTNLKDASFHTAVVDGSTLFWRCQVNRGTDFRGVGLGNLRIDPGTKQLLEYNARCMNWEEWYKNNPKMKWLVKPFWMMSDYGLSTWRIIITFFGLALIFANIYYHWARIAPPGIVSNLILDENGASVPLWLVPLRTLYFSIVTMTTLGFGDMYARGQSIFGHLFLMVQVVLGYVLLGALVTRFAVLFTSGGPAGKFSPIKTEETGEDKKQ